MAERRPLNDRDIKLISAVPVTAVPERVAAAGKLFVATAGGIPAAGAVMAMGFITSLALSIIGVVLFGATAKKTNSGFTMDIPGAKGLVDNLEAASKYVFEGGLSAPGVVWDHEEYGLKQNMRKFIFGAGLQNHERIGLLLGNIEKANSIEDFRELEKDAVDEIDSRKYEDKGMVQYDQSH